MINSQMASLAGRGTKQTPTKVIFQRLHHIARQFKNENTVHGCIVPQSSALAI